MYRSAARGLGHRRFRTCLCTALAVIRRTPKGALECGTSLVYVQPGRVANSGVSQDRVRGTFPGATPNATSRGPTDGREDRPRIGRSPLTVRVSTWLRLDDGAR